MIGIVDKKTTLKNLLTKQILDGELDGGDQLPSERELVEMHQISRTTVRLALEEMGQDGILIRHQRSGTFVAAEARDLINQRESHKVMTAAFILPLSRFYNPVLRGAFDAFCDALDDRIAGRVFFHNFFKPDLYRRHGVDVLIIDDQCDHEHVDMLRSEFAHVIMINREASGMPYVCIDNYQGGRLQAEHILSKGHTKVGCLHFGTRDPDNEMTRRYKGIADVFTEQNIPLHSLLITEGNRPYYQAIDRLLRQVPDLTAILCLSDLTVANVYETLAEKEIEIPNKISVIGFDDQTCVGSLCPPLTTVRHPVIEIGNRLASAVNGLLDDKKLKLADRVTPTLIERQSVLNKHLPQ